MQVSKVTAKGQITIPASVRYEIGIHSGDSIGFFCQNGRVHLIPIIDNIDAAFGLISTTNMAKNKVLQR